MILAVDVGTTTIKAGLFSDGGRLERSASAALRMSRSEDPMAHEIPAAEWVGGLAALASSLLAGSARPDCVVLSGNGPTLLPADAEGRPLRDAVTWMDRRAALEAAEASAVAGIPIDPAFRLPKALWFMRRYPETYERTAYFLSCPEYLALAIAGEACTVVPAGYERHYGEDAALAALGLDARKFPRLVRPGHLAGAATSAGEAATGVPRGTRVVVAGPDFLAALVGTATTAPGRACDRAGTSEGINLCALRGVEDARLLSVPHIVPPYANVSGTISNSGGAVDWWKRASGREAEGYESFFEDLGLSAPGASKLLFLPYLSGERSPILDPAARGAFLGLTLGHGRREMARAVVESTAFAMRDVIEVMEAAGAPVSELRVTGSPGKSPVWNQIKADATGRPILLPEGGDSELLGDACIGLAATGRYGSIAQAAEDLARMVRRFDPDPSARALYDDLFGAYRAAYAALKPVFGMLALARSGRSPG